MKLNDLKSIAGKACIDIYMSIHVSQTNGISEPMKKAWSIGQELYFESENKQCDHDFIRADNEAVKRFLICIKCKTVKAT